MRKYLFSSARVLTVGALLSLVAAAPANAAPHGEVNASECREGSFSQPFLSLKDKNWYTLAPGQSASGFSGAGWELTGGARIVTATLPNGETGSVLDLPSGARAVSPVLCVTSDYPTARAYVRNVVGGEGVAFNVSYEGTETWERPKNTGQIHGPGKAGWGPSGNVNLRPEDSFSGWQPMRIILVPGGKTSDFQVSQLYLDPRLGH